MSVCDVMCLIDIVNVLFYLNEMFVRTNFFFSFILAISMQNQDLKNFKNVYRSPCLNLPGNEMKFSNLLTGIEYESLDP